jgi:hypothetical protein
MSIRALLLEKGLEGAGFGAGFCVLCVLSTFHRLGSLWRGLGGQRQRPDVGMYGGSAFGTEPRDGRS